MFANLALIAFLVFALWIATLAVYFFVNRQQADIDAEISALRRQLGAANDETDHD